MLNKIKNNPIFRNFAIKSLKIISVLNKIIYKRDKYIFFYDSREDMFTDNSRAMFNYLIQNNFNSIYKIIISSPNNNKINLLEEYHNVSVVGRSLGIIYFMISKYAFYSYGSLFIKPSNSQVVTNLWHGTPLKKIEHLLRADHATMEDRDFFTYLISPSRNFNDIFSKAFSCDSNKIIVSGNPRNDFLISNKDILKELGIDKKIYKKVLIWMPTFRVSKDERFHDGVETETGLPLLGKTTDLAELNEYLKEQGVFLIIKAHPLASISVINFTNILTTNDNAIEEHGLQLYELIGTADALITDYSSVFFDYLLLDRPIGFIIDDLDTYLVNRGFVFDDPLKYMPGHHINTKGEFYGFLKDVLNGVDHYSVCRHKVNNFANRYKVNNNCKRLLQKIGLENSD